MSEAESTGYFYPGYERVQLLTEDLYFVQLALSIDARLFDRPTEYQYYVVVQMLLWTLSSRRPNSATVCGFLRTIAIEPNIYLENAVIETRSQLQLYARANGIVAGDRRYADLRYGLTRLLQQYKPTPFSPDQTN